MLYIMMLVLDVQCSSRQRHFIPHWLAYLLTGDYMHATCMLREVKQQLHSKATRVQMYLYFGQTEPSLSPCTFWAWTKRGSAEREREGRGEHVIIRSGIREAFSCHVALATLLADQSQIAVYESRWTGIPIIARFTPASTCTHITLPGGL